MAILRQSHDGKRLGKLVRLLASDKPGEVTAAAAAIIRTLQSAGSDIHALAAIVDRAPLIRQTPSTPPDDDDRPWRAIRDWCSAHDEYLTPRELEFVLDLGYWRGHPTKKQMDWLLLIESKIRARQARS